MVKRAYPTSESRIFGGFRILASPSLVLAFVTLFSFALFFFASNLDDSYVYFRRLVLQEQIVDSSTYTSYIWTALAFLSFYCGTRFVEHAKVARKGYSQGISDQRSAFRSLRIAFVITFAISFAWVGGAIIEFGGISTLAKLAASDNIAARDVILAASFPGGRLLSSGFIGISVYSATLLGAGFWKHDPRKRLFVTAILFASLLYLGLIPILISGRILFFVALIGCLIGASFSARRIVGLRYIVIGAIFLSLVWTAKQYFTLGHVAEDVSAVDQGIGGLIFYFYNDVLNILNTIGRFDGHYTLGWYSLRFLFFFTFTDKSFLNYIADERDHVGNLVTAGEIPMLGAPLVDFGLFGFVFLFFIGGIFQYFYIRAFRSFTFSAVYGIFFACLLFSMHSFFATSQEVIYSILLILFLSRGKRKISPDFRRHERISSFSAVAKESSR